jgi:uncharacterized protein DUF4349
MSKIFTWIKANTLVFILILVVLYLLIGRIRPISYFESSSYSTPTYGAISNSKSMVLPSSGGGMAEMAEDRGYEDEASYDLSTSGRMVIQNSHLSLVVKNVSQSLKAIKDYVEDLDGFLVNSNISRPEEGGDGSITLRVPAKNIDQALTYFQQQAIKVVSLNLQGSDVTDQYEDNEAKLIILRSNKARFEQIMDKAEKVDEILRVQREVFNLQSQIDSIIGRQRALEKNSNMAKITIYLSTDELSLPYSPSNAWRPTVIFKQAVRSLLTNLRGLGNLAIWLGVYSVIIVPLLLVVKFISKKLRRKQNQ